MSQIAVTADTFSRKPRDVNIVVRNLEQQEYSGVSKNWFGNNGVLTASMNVF